MSKDKITFKQAFQELEEIANSFDSEELDLENSIEKFERASFLSKICKQKLIEIENKVHIINQNFKQDE